MLHVGGSVSRLRDTYASFEKVDTCLIGGHVLEAHLDNSPPPPFFLGEGGY